MDAGKLWIYEYYRGNIYRTLAESIFQKIWLQLFRTAHYVMLCSRNVYVIICCLCAHRRDNTPKMLTAAGIIGFAYLVWAVKIFSEKIKQAITLKQHFRTYLDFYPS